MANGTNCRIKVLTLIDQKKFQKVELIVIFATTFQNIILLYQALHKKLVASFLLAVYFFVCMPASAWHSHTKLTTQKSTTSFENQIGCFFESTADETSENNCKICAHQYQVHNNDAIQPLLSELILISSEKISFECSSLKGSVYTFFNKGPPVLI